MYLSYKTVHQLGQRTSKIENHESIGSMSWKLSLRICTALVVGYDDVAPCYSVGVLTGRQVGS